MTLQEAIEEVKDEVRQMWDEEYQLGDFSEGGLTPAIATILNAVVKGELK